MKKILICCTILCYLLCGCSKNTKIDSDKAFRTARDVDSNDIYYFDEEAVATSDILVDNNLRSTAIEAYDQVNDIREDYGLNTLSWDGKLEQVAKVRARECSQSFSHTRPNGEQWYTVNSKIQGGENLAYGFDTATDVVNAWMDSPSHRDNILYDDFKTMAIAIYELDGELYISQQFGY